MWVIMGRSGMRAKEVNPYSFAKILSPDPPKNDLK